MALIKIIVKMVKFLRVEKVSAVSAGANGLTIKPIWQSDEKREKENTENYKFDIKILQTDDEKRVSYGCVHESSIVDFQGKVFSTEVLTQACNTFSKEVGATGTNRNHRNEDGKVISDPSDAVIVQNFMLNSEGDDRFPGIHTPAWVQVREYPKTTLGEQEWLEMKNGETPYISLEGFGHEEEIEIEIEENMVRVKPKPEKENNDSTGNSAKQNLDDDKTIEARLSFIERALQTLGIKPKIKKENNDMKKEDVEKLLDVIKTELTEEISQQNKKFEAKLSEFETQKVDDDNEQISLEDFKKTVLENIQTIQTNFDNKLEKIAKSADLSEDLGQSVIGDDAMKSLANVYGFGSIKKTKTETK